MPLEYCVEYCVEFNFAHMLYLMSDADRKRKRNPSIVQVPLYNSCKLIA